ncbi:MAG: dethiobiotin synthase [Chthoniobacter sp.]|nr:dethiobiotin synthase [Chthoniobacter sp.]
MNLFLTGTDTNVGKTYAASLLVRALRAAGRDCVGMKPICCGGREDAEALHAACGRAIALNDVNPVWLRPPAAPYTAAMIKNRPIDLALIWETFARLRGAHESLIVEGVGGWLVPITRDYFVADLAVEFAMPVAVVVANRLGALNHTLLTVQAIRARGLKCAGLVLNHTLPPTVSPDIATTTNRAMLEDLVDVPVLFEITHGQREIVLAAR